MTRKSRPPRDAGATSFERYLRELRAASPVCAGSARNQVATVSVATCAGLAELSGRYGVSLCHIGVGEGSGGAAPAADYACGVVDEREPDGFASEEGWSDWSGLALTPDMTRGSPLPDGVRLRGSGLLLELQATVNRARLARRLRLHLHAWRFEEVLTRGPSLATRRRAGRPLAVSPRFSRASSGWERVETIYVFDPWRDLVRLGVIAAACACEDAVGGQAQPSGDHERR